MLSIIDVPPLDGIGKDRALVKKYRVARHAWRAEHPHVEAAKVTQPWQAK